MKSLLFFFMIVSVFLNGIISREALSSDRIQDLLARDAEEAMDLIIQKKSQLQDYKEQLDEMDSHLKETSKGQMAYLQFDRIAGSIIVVGIMVGSYKTKFPPGLRAMIAAYTTVTGISRGFIKLTPIQIRLFSGHVKLLNTKISTALKKLDEEGTYYCKRHPSHNLCSY